MIENNGYNIKIEELFQMLGLGEVVKEPKSVIGGLLHKSFKVLTEDKCYFVKALNPKIMERPTVMEHYKFSDKVSQIVSESEIPASTVLEIKNKTIHCVDRQYYQVFDWVESEPYVHTPDNLEVCRSIGRILGDIHCVDFSAIYGQSLHMDEKNAVNWIGILEDAKRDDILGDLKNHIDFDYIEDIEKSSLMALNELSNLVVSHRDLDPKNTMWGREGILVIDWEASGYINPMHELAEVALYWSEYEDGTISDDSFLAVLSGYEEVSEIIVQDLKNALEAVNYNKIGWIEYNLKRALGIESNSEEECKLGYEQVVATLKSIEQYEEQKDEILGLLTKV